MGRFLRFGLMGCGGLTVVVVLIIVALLAFGGGGSDTASSDPGGPTAPEEPGEAEKETPPAPMGQTVEVGTVAWQVTSAEQATELYSDFGDQKQGNFVRVNFMFQNNGNEAVTLDSSSVAIVDGQKRESQVDTDNAMYTDPNKDVFLQQVNPGVTREGEVIFTVAPDASDFNLLVGDANMFGGPEALVDLGF